MNADPHYMTAQDVADYCKVKRNTIWQYLSRGRIPEPDLIWYSHPLWLPETIHEWRAQMRTTGDRRANELPARKRKRRLVLKRNEKIKQPNTVRRDRPPRIEPPTSNGASLPLVSVVSEQIARQIASALRQAGHHCTTEDVMLLAASKGEPGRERDLLRQRVQAKLRGLKARA